METTFGLHTKKEVKAKTKWSKILAKVIHGKTAFDVFPMTEISEINPLLTPFLNHEAANNPASGPPPILHESHDLHRPIEMPKNTPQTREQKTTNFSLLSVPLNQLNYRTIPSKPQTLPRTNIIRPANVKKNNGGSDTTWPSIQIL